MYKNEIRMLCGDILGTPLDWRANNVRPNVMPPLQQLGQWNRITTYATADFYNMICVIDTDVSLNLRYVPVRYFAKFLCTTACFSD